MTRLEVEKIRNHVSNIPHVGGMYLPEALTAYEELLAENKDLQAQLQAALARVATLERIGQLRLNRQDELQQEATEARACEARLIKRLAECLKEHP